MRNTLIFSIILLICFSCFQKKENKNSLNPKVNKSETKYQARRDSILEQKDYGSIYLTSDTSAMSYKYLNPEKIDSTVFQTILLDMMKGIETKYKTQVKHFIHDLTNTNWTSLYWFDNNYCLYGPSDWMSNIPILITDSTLYFLNSDPMVEIIKNYKSIAKNTYEFTSINYSGKMNFTTIEIIDQKRGISIWEYKDENKKTIEKVLKVKSENVKSFPIIICDCVNGTNKYKCVFERRDIFQTPNFEELKATNYNNH